MKLEDGIYEVDDLFYEDRKFAVVVAQNDVEFTHNASSEIKLKLEVLHPDLDFSKSVKIPKGVSRKRCEFMKSVLKSVLASSTSYERMTKTVADMLDVFCGCSIFETSFFLHALLSCGLGYYVQKNGAPSAESVVPRRGLGAVVSRIILACPNYIKFRRALSLNAEHGDPVDIKLRSALMEKPFSLTDYSWTKSDAEESFAIVKANQFLSRYI